MSSAGSFQIALYAVIPIFLVILVGVLVRRANLMSQEAIGEANRLSLYIFLTVMTFYNVYTTDFSQLWRPDVLVLFLILLAGIAIEVFACWLIMRKLSWSSATKGTMMMIAFRTNLMIISIPMAQAIYDDIGLVSIACAAMTPVYNVLSIVILEKYNTAAGKKSSAWDLTLRSVKNPLVLAVIIAMALVALRVKLPYLIEKPISDIAVAAPAMALIVVGASFNPARLSEDWKKILVASLLRLVVIPGVMLGLGIALGYRGIALMAIMAVFANPFPPAGYTMAREMNGDADLASGYLIVSTLLAAPALFGWVYLLSRCSLL